MSKDLSVIGKDELNAVFNSNSIDDKPDRIVFPDSVKILTDITKQSKYFTDYERLNPSLLGKMFVRPQGVEKSEAFVTTDNLRSVITGTMLRVQYGTEVYPLKTINENGVRIADKDKMPISKFSGHLGGENKRQWEAENPDLVLRSGVKVIFTEVESSKLAQSLLMKQMDNREENPLKVITMDGMKLPEWFNATTEAIMQLREKYPDQKSVRFSKVLAPLFKFSLSTKLAEFNGRENYVFSFKWGFNSIEDALVYKPVAEQLTQFINYYGKPLNIDLSTGEVVKDEEVKALLTSQHQEGDNNVSYRKMLRDLEVNDDAIPQDVLDSLPF